MPLIGTHTFSVAKELGAIETYPITDEYSSFSQNCFCVWSFSQLKSYMADRQKEIEEAIKSDAAAVPVVTEGNIAILYTCGIIVN